jgi:hypothetical protein
MCLNNEGESLLEKACFYNMLVLGRCEVNALGRGEAEMVNFTRWAGMDNYISFSLWKNGPRWKYQILGGAGPYWSTCLHHFLFSM